MKTIHFEKGLIEKIVTGNNLLVIVMDCSGVSVQFLNSDS
jgi:hypothetical protein